LDTIIVKGLLARLAKSSKLGELGPVINLGHGRLTVKGEKISFKREIQVFAHVELTKRKMLAINSGGSESTE
jgi:hypothetical protein